MDPALERFFAEEIQHERWYEQGLISQSMRDELDYYSEQRLINERIYEEIEEGNIGGAISKLEDSISLMLDDTERNIARAWDELAGLFGSPKKDGTTSE
jgi:hypothetical protein